MSLTKEFKEEIITKFGGIDKNTGKTEVQVALFSNRISDLTGHLQEASERQAFPSWSADACEQA